MNIEQRLAEAICSFGLDALAGAVPLNVDLDVVLSVLAHTVCAALRRRLPGYSSAVPDTLQRRFLNTGGIITSHGGQITVFGKNSRTRAITLPAEVWADLARQRGAPEDLVFPSRSGRALDRGRVRVILRRAAERAGLTESISPRWLRHAHASHALDHGVPIHLVQATLAQGRALRYGLVGALPIRI